MCFDLSPAWNKEKIMSPHEDTSRQVYLNSDPLDTNVNKFLEFCYRSMFQK